MYLYNQCFINVIPWKTEIKQNKNFDKFGVLFASTYGCFHWYFLVFRNICIVPLRCLWMQTIKDSDIQNKVIFFQNFYNKPISVFWMLSFFFYLFTQNATYIYLKAKQNLEIFFSWKLAKSRVYYHFFSFFISFVLSSHLFNLFNKLPS